MGQIYGLVLGIKSRRTEYNVAKKGDGIGFDGMGSVHTKRNETKGKRAKNDDDDKRRTKLYMSRKYGAESAWTNIMKFAARYCLGNIVFELEAVVGRCTFSRCQHI